MLSLIFLLCLSLVVFIQGAGIFDKKQVMREISLSIGVVSFVVWLWFFLTDEIEPSIFYIFLAYIFIYGMYKINSFAKADNLEIVANQQRFYDEITPKMVFDFYKFRRIEKQKRVDVKLNKAEKKLIRTIDNKEFLSLTFFIKLKKLKPTKINNLDEINKSKVYKAVFDKLQEFIKSSEVVVSYSEILKENGG